MTLEWLDNSLTSPVYTVLAGPSQTAFKIHTGVASHHSPVLRALFSNPKHWEENKSQKISWEEWDETTVGRFIRFLYTGDYTWPDIPVSSASPTIAESPPVVDSLTPPDQAAQDSGPAGPLTPILSSLPAGFDKPPSKPTLHIQWASTLSSNNDNSPSSCVATSEAIEAILLCHASLYALALYAQVEALADLALGNLIMALSWTPGLKHAPKIVDLVRYVYDNTPPASDHGPDRMRSVIARYCAQNHKAFIGSHVNDLVQEGGDFMIDYLELILKGLRWYEKELSEKVTWVNTMMESESRYEKLVWDEKSSHRRTQNQLTSAETDLTNEKATTKRLRAELAVTNKKLASVDSRSSPVPRPLSSYTDW